MLNFSNTNVLLCVTGGIAAYKSAEIIRLFKKDGADVRVVMTESAKEFITPLTLQAVSGNKIHDSLLDVKAESAMGHIELAKWADIILIAPCTAESLAKITHGRADDLMGSVIHHQEYFLEAPTAAHRKHPGGSLRDIRLIQGRHGACTPP